MKIEFLEKLTEEQSECLRSQDVCLDDWEYMLVVEDLNLFEEIEEKEADYDYITGETTRRYVINFYSKSYQLDRLLTGCYDNIWKKIKWEGKEVIIGIAYHA